jgi:ABC-type cobalamin/Fe3+-siderophores transport system ATPase subunit
MLESHLASDFCLIGPKGCGKSTTIQRLADLLGYQVEPIVLYQASHLARLLLLHENDDVSSCRSSIRDPS